MLGQRHWDAWMWNCAMGLLPFTLWFVVHMVVVGGHNGVATQASRELLFFALSTCTLALVTLRAAPPPQQRWIHRLTFHACLLILIGAAALYGMFLTSEALHAAIQGRSMYDWSRGTAIVAFLLGVFAQHYDSRGE